MRKTDRLIYSEIIPPTLLTCFVLTALVLGREFGSFSALVVSRSASIGQVLEIIACILPRILIFTLPLALMVGSIIGLSRLSSDNEITALRAGGINLLTLVAPLQLIASIVCLANFATSLYLYPVGNNHLNTIQHELTTRVIPTELRPRLFFEDFQNYILYIDDLDEKHSLLKGIFLVDMQNQEDPSLITSKTGRMILDEAGKRLQLHLENGQIYKIPSKDGKKESISTFISSEFPIPFKEASGNIRPKKPNEKTTSELMLGIDNYSTDKLVRSEHQLELQKRLALPISALIFALIALPLSLTAGKSGRTAGFISSMILVIVYYNLLLIGLRMASVGKISPLLGAWGANILMAVLGLVSMTMINRQFGKSRIVSFFQKILPEKLFFQKLHKSLQKKILHNFPFFSDPHQAHRSRFRLSQIIDSYMIRGILLFFFLTVLVCASLFVILTLFDLTDDIARNRVPWSNVVAYLWYLLPQIIVFILPICTLVAILVHFSILEKSRQIVAFKAGGVSQFRLAIPALLLAAIFSALNFYLQENVLPYCNQRQDSLRNIIKGRSKTARPERKWIMGKQNRIFNYQNFNGTSNTFSGLTIYEWEKENYRLIRRMVAQKASWTGGDKWLLESGWERNYTGTSSSYSPFAGDKLVLPLQEEPDYFRSEIFDPKESSKMSYTELEEHIDVMERSGYDVIDLKVSLYKKIAFPMATLVMALLAIPFSFSLGRKGALGGIMISLVLGVVYWATLGMFESAGNYGLLTPVLAAWAPNFLFGIGGLYFFLGMKT